MRLALLLLALAATGGEGVLLWDTRSVPYSLAGLTDASLVSSVLAAMRDVEALSCVHFQAKHDQADWIHVVADTAGCLSAVGRQGGVQLLRLAPGCREKGDILHELMHSLGLWHEHARADRDGHVTVRWSNIQPAHWKEYDIRVMAAEVLQLPYDVSSLMHYRGSEFALRSDQPTLSPKHGSLVLGQRDHLTDGDRGKLNALYHCNVSRCPLPESIGDASRGNPATSIGSLVHYSCPESKRRYGVTTRQCLTQGHWSARAPLCVANTLAICTFEDSAFCGWTEPEPPLLRWLRHSGDRMSLHTGPEHDHTAMDHTGHYVFLQVIPESEEGFSATLVSPTFHFAGADVCLLLHSHMFSTDGGLGTLRVSAKNPSTTRVLLERTGNRGNLWLKDILQVPFKTDFQVTIEAIQGESFLSAIAIDDIVVGPCVDIYRSFAASSL